MKKLLALGLSLAMMASLSAVAFALEDPQTINEPKTSDEVKVFTTFDEEDLDDYENWTVTIPADVEIPWGDDENSYSLEASATGIIESTAKLKVSVTPVAQLTNEAGVGSLDVTWGGFESQEITAAELADGENLVSTVQVVAGQFEKSGLELGTYSNTTTYTVEVVRAGAGA